PLPLPLPLPHAPTLIPKLPLLEPVSAVLPWQYVYSNRVLMILLFWKKGAILAEPGGTISTLEQPVMCNHIYIPCHLHQKAIGPSVMQKHPRYFLIFRIWWPIITCVLFAV